MNHGGLQLSHGAPLQRARAAPAITRALSDPSRAQTFALFDKDGGGTIDAEELGSLMRALGHSLEQHEIDELVKRADADNSGEIDFGEFCALMAEELMKFDDRAELKLIFDKLDHSGNGEINAKELRRISTRSAAMSSPQIRRFRR